MNIEQELAQAETTVTLTPESLILEKEGQSIRVYYLYNASERVTDRKTGETSVKNFAYFFDGKKIMFNMGVTLVEQFQKMNIPSGTPIEIKLTQLKKRDGGKTLKIYSVSPLTAKPIDVQSIFGCIKILPVAPEKLLQGGALMTYDQAAAWSFRSGGTEYVIGNIGDPAKLRTIIENAKDPRTIEAARIVLEHDFSMMAAAQDIAAASEAYIYDPKEAVGSTADGDDFPF